jgi:hypothetical protein
MPLFNDPNDAVDAVRRDLETGFSDILQPNGPLNPVGKFSDVAIGSGNDEISVLAWEQPVIHVGSLQGTPPTGKELILRGVTIIDGNGGDPLYSRYIDWLALYADIGAITIARPAVEDRFAIAGQVDEPVEDDPVA